MSLTVVWEKLSLDKPVETDKTGKVTKTEVVILRRGQSLPDYASDFIRSTLTQIGAVRDLGAPIDALQAANDADFAEEPPTPVRPAEVPPDNLHPNGPDATNSTGTPVAPDSTKPDDAPAGETKPGLADNKEAWENYAVAREYFTRSEAEAMTKTKLVAEVNKRENS